MQNDAAVFRTQSSLEEGCKNIDETVASFADVKVRSCHPMFHQIHSMGKQCL
jgi:succinate dehydrogenase/fumarate reductase flavoprotein subunit